MKFDYELVAVHKTRTKISLIRLIVLVLLYWRKLNYFCIKLYTIILIKLDCSYHYTDTDSVFLNINAPLDSDMETEVNKIKDILHNNELGKMEDELHNDTIIEARFLKSKAYCYTIVKREGEKKSKGITKATIKNQITIEDYKNAIYDAKSKHVTNCTINSKKHH